MPAVVRVAQRCVTHPGRIAADQCPVCERPRCNTEVTTYAERGCAVCSTGARPAAATSVPEATVRSALAALAAAYVGGWVLTEYVNVHLMSLIAPAILGLATAWAAGGVGGASSPRRVSVLVAAIAAVLGTALGVRFFGRPLTPVHPWRQVGPPYLAALVGVALWPLLFGPVRRQSGS